MSTRPEVEEVQIPQGELVALQIGAIVRLTPVMMTANVVNVAATLFALRSTHRIDTPTLVWAAAVTAYASFMLWAWARRRDRPFPRYLSTRTRRRTIGFAVVLGLLWAYPGLAILPTAPPLAQAFLVALCAGMVAGGSIALYPIPVAALSYATVIVLAHMVGFALTGQTVFWSFGLVAVMFLGVIAWNVRRHEQVFASEFLLRRQLDVRTAMVERLLAETQSEAIQQKREAEAKLAQVQRLDSVGRLTAGVAHDFNNLLAAIMGNIELAQLRPGEKTERELLGEALEATRRGARLTQQLLAFGRKAMLRPEPTDPAGVIEELLVLLRRTMPANVEVETDAEDQAHLVHADPAQLGNALLNLVLNARDAMPDGGTVRITTRPVRIEPGDAATQGEDAVTPGDYVGIAVADTGTGVPPDVLPHVFEPFFTTKGIGEGSGLGLAMVYGFVRQSGGQSVIESVPGEGTRVTMILPTDAAAASTAVVAPVMSRPLRGRAERIMVVEDAADVRKVVATQLRTLGYRVVVAPDGESALEMLRTGSGIDLLLTDLAMPGAIQGEALAAAARAEGLVERIVLMSGHPEGPSQVRQAALPDVPVLRKPVDMAALSRAIRDALHAAAPRRVDPPARETSHRRAAP
jgi:signal transduction histidine kinase/CheY-like chemotaxis protein